MKHSTREKLYRIFDGSPVSGADRCWALVVAGVSQAELAEKLGVSRPAISQVLHDKDISYNVATTVAEATGLPLKRLWPDGRYNKSPAERRAKSQALKEAA